MSGWTVIFFISSGSETVILPVKHHKTAQQRRGKRGRIAVTFRGLVLVLVAVVVVAVVARNGGGGAVMLALSAR